jgi:hypothetical protein
MVTTPIEAGSAPLHSATVELEHVLTVAFGDADAAPVPANWDMPENGRRWARGRQSELVLPRPEAPGDLIALLTVEPFVFPPVLRQQTLRILVNGKTVRLAHLRMTTVFACLIEEAAVAGSDTFTLTFDHPNIAQPSMISASSDSRGYSIGFVSLTLLRRTGTVTLAPTAAPACPGLPPAVEDLSDSDLMLRFASVGDNCEFGMVQRAHGAAPMDLLRFTGLAGDRHPGLLRGLERGFAGVETFHDLEFELYPTDQGREYVLHHRLYDFQSHTTIIEGTTTAERLFVREHKKLALLRRLFISDLLSSNRIFVYKRNDAAAVTEIRPILERMRRWGPNTLLFVTLADAVHRPGTVEQHADGLIVGYIDRFNPYHNATADASELWLPICRRSYELWRDEHLASVRTAHPIRSATRA